MNRLGNENSPYLLQHASNPVDWYPWGDAAFEKARKEDKPIFLSIGYSACHWCHVMAHESFENPATAEMMNRYFVNIKVDREERPDIDGIYMNAVVAMTGQGGWPMSVFLSPQLEPFFGGTYYPPVRRYNMPAFQEVLLGVANAWNNKRSELLRSSQDLVRHIRVGMQAPQSGRGIDLTPGLLDQAAFRLVQTYDWRSGGWGQAPKFPQPMVIEFLLDRAALGDQLASEIAVHALDAMSRGGMYDLLGGGFARYSTDNDWLIPHFEKMLYDNAQLALAYLRGYLITGNERYRTICESTLDFILREMTLISDETGPSGGFFSSLDADSEGVEGKYYCWTYAELKSILSSDQFELATTVYNLSTAGNFEGAIILQQSAVDSILADQLGLTREQFSQRLEELNRQLLSIRTNRIRPMTDDKIIVSWNGLALVAFAEAARYLNRPEYLDAARRNADFLLTELHSDNRLMRVWRNGKVGNHYALLEDYASLILGLISLYQSDPDIYWFNSAWQLADEMITHFLGEDGLLYDTTRDQADLIVRPRDMQDNATPSGNALAALALIQLAAITGKGAYRDQAEVILGSGLSVILDYPVGFGKWLCAIQFGIKTISEIAILSPDLELAFPLINRLWSGYRPFTIAAISIFPPPDEAPPLCLNRPLIENLPTAYVCTNFICKQPVITPDDLSAQLEVQQ
jgi:uncharacterized protein YyaL (SSP411 family)